MTPIILDSYTFNSTLKISDIPNKITFKNTTVSDLKFDNQSKLAIVSPNVTLGGSFNLNLQPKSNQAILRQIVIGYKGVGPKLLIFSEQKITGKWLKGLMSLDASKRMYVSYANYLIPFQIEAPLHIGLYELEFKIIELQGEVSVQKNGQPSFELAFEDQVMLSSPNALERLWKIEENSCLLSLGLVRVL